MFTEHKVNSVFSDKHLYNWLTAAFMLALLYIYHGFLIYNSDTIETVPYALWLADNTLYTHDFHLSHLREIIPNERWIISYILHFFPSNITNASYFFHASFSLILLAGMIRFADNILRHFEFAVLSVFITLFSLYAINVGGNELYYNMLVPSLASKSIAIWSLFFFYKNTYINSIILLIISSFLHPLVGLQLFVILSAILFINKSTTRDKLLFITVYLCTAGILIGFILYNQFTTVIPLELENTFVFFDIVKYRIGHHFIPYLFPIKSIIFYAVLYIIGIIYYRKRIDLLFYFYCIALLGILVYIVGIYAEWEIVLSSQWMKINIWLKFFGVMALFGWVQKVFERKHYRLIVLLGFVGALGIALLRFSPTYDPPTPSDLYSWVSIHTEQHDVFLLPDELLDFKAKTLRSSYFDYKAMLHHKPAIYYWAEKFQEIYGIDVAENRVSTFSIPSISESYLKGDGWSTNSNIDYIIISREKKNSIRSLESDGKNLVFLGDKYVVFENNQLHGKEK